MGTNKLSGTMIACGIAGAIAFGTGGAQAATGSAAGKAVTLRALSIVKLRDLDFGTNAVGATAGTVSIDPDTNTRSTTGGVVAAGGTPQSAEFITYGAPNTTLQVSRGPLPVLTRVGGGATMNVTQITLNGTTTRFINAAGFFDLFVGGTLAVAANQLAGAYTGTFDITVVYN